MAETEIQIAVRFTGLKSYLAFARKHPEPIRDVAEAIRCVAMAMQSTGLLRFPDGHGPQQMHDPANFFVIFASRVSDLAIAWKKYTARFPIETAWDRDTAEQFLQLFKPLMAMHRAVAS